MIKWQIFRISGSVCVKALSFLIGTLSVHVAACFPCFGVSCRVVSIYSVVFSNPHFAC